MVTVLVDVDPGGMLIRDQHLMQTLRWQLNDLSDALETMSPVLLEAVADQLSLDLRSLVEKTLHQNGAPDRLACTGTPQHSHQDPEAPPSV